MKHFYIKSLILFWFACCALNAAAQTNAGVKLNRTKADQIDNVTIFPNPATDRFTINVDHGVIKYITINNIIGKEIKKLRATSTNSFEISELRRGVYIIRVFDTKDELIKALRLSKT